MICHFWVSLIFLSDASLCPASPSLQWVDWVSLPHPLGLIGFDLRYYDPLRLLLHLLGLLRFSLASRYLACLPFVFVFFFKTRNPGSRLPVLHRAFFYTGRLSIRCFSRGVNSPLKFPAYPFIHMPCSSTPVVSTAFAITRIGFVPSSTGTLSAF